MNENRQHQTKRIVSALGKLNCGKRTYAVFALCPKWAFGKVLREYRTHKQMSQEDLAEAAGLDRSFISMVERGIQSPNIVVLIKIAEVLEVPAAELIARMESAIRKPG